jgi:hypothetical protein
MSLGLPDPSSLFSSGNAPGLMPRVKVAKAASGGGGLGSDLLSAAASALGVGAAQSDPLTDALVAVSIQLAPAPFLPTCRLAFLPRSDFPGLNLGDKLTVSLGSGEEPTPVFSGQVATLANRQGALEVMLSAPAAALARIRRNAGYENQSFSDLLSTWAGEAEVQVGDVDSGPDYAFFAVDDRRSLWEWIARLARHADVPVWIDAEGKLNAKKPAGQPVAKFGWGETLISLDATARDPVTTAARVVGEGSAGRQGSDAWSWLAKDPEGVSAAAGSGPAGAVSQDGGLRDLASVAGAAAGMAAAGARIADLVRISVPGTAALDVASVFELANCPGGYGDGQWSAVEVRHRFTAGGFVTEVLGVVL